MDLTIEQRIDIITLIKEHVAEKGNCRVGWAIEQIAGDSFVRSIHWKEKIANTIIQSGKYIKEPSLQVTNDWNILLNPAHNKFSRIDKINLLFNIFNFSCILISTAIAYWGIKSNEEIAVKSGALDKGQFRLNLNQELMDAGDIDVYYACKTKDTNSIALLNLNLEVVNVGKKTMEDAKMIIKYSEGNVPTKKELKLYGVDTSFENRKFDTVDNQAIYSLPSMNPGLATAVSEYIYVKDRILSFRIQAVRKNKETVESQPITMKLATTVDIKLTAKDFPVMTYTFTLHYINADDLKIVAAEIVKQKLEDVSTSDTSTYKFYIVFASGKNAYFENPFKNASIVKSNNDLFFTCSYDKSSASVLMTDSHGNRTDFKFIN